MTINSYHTTNKEFSYWQSFAITAAILLFGFVIQWFTGGIKLDYFRFPVNLLLLVFSIVVIVVGFFKFPTHRIVVWLSSTKAAISSIVGFSVITLLMGFITQEPSSNKIISGLGLNNLAFSWEYSLMLFYFILSLGFATIKRIFPFRKKNFWFILNHLGLWIAICSANFGFVDQVHVRMKLTTDEYKNFAVDQNGLFYGLPFDLKQIDLKQLTNDKSNIELTVSILSENKEMKETISVNHPLKVNGWNIYFFDMNKNKNSESNTAIVELIKEPWHPFTYFGLILLMMGSFFVFWRGKN
jgi:hypothetical protein